MRAYVFTDKALERVAGQFVWLSVNTEKASNAAFVQKYTISAWPTLYIIDPVKEAVTKRWVGGATVPQLLNLLHEGEQLAGKTRGLQAALAGAEKTYGAGSYKESVPQFQKVLSQAPPKWPQYGHTVESLLYALSTSGDDLGCTELAMAALPRVRGTSSEGNVAASGLGCALAVDKKETMRSEWVKTFEIASQKALDNPRLDLSGDDRSGIYIGLIDARDDLGDKEGKQRIAEQWATFLEREAAKAKTADARSVYDSHRLGAYLELGHPERAVEMLEASERDLPDDYNPPARLAVAWLALKQYDKALAASDRAMAKAYGPRMLGILRTRADIYQAMGNSAEAQKTVEKAISFAEALPDGQRSDRQIQSLKKKLESLTKS
ncbi:MAG: thiol reductase thioredoxin [Acidobacteriota bacterium]